MALDSLGYRYGHTTVWPMVALYKQAHPPSPAEKRPPNPAERPRQTTAPHQVWFVDVRSLVHDQATFSGIARCGSWVH
jgi:hypothetical protein